MGLTVSGSVDFSGGVESGGLESHWTFINYFIERSIAQIVIPNEFCFWLFGECGRMDKKYVGLSIFLVVI